MQEARASWNTIYIDSDGFECQITLRDESESDLAERVATITERIINSGGTPVVRRNFNSGTRNGSKSSNSAQNGSDDSQNGDARNKTYVDSKGVRRCNLKLETGRRCNEQVTEKEGRYGLFWACPNYRDHAARTSS